MDIRRVQGQDALESAKKNTRPEATESSSSSFEELLTSLTSGSRKLEEKTADTESLLENGAPSASQRILQAIELASETQEKFRELRALLTSAYDGLEQDGEPEEITDREASPRSQSPE